MHARNAPRVRVYFLAAWLAQILGGTVAFIYNVLARVALGAPNGGLPLWGKLYFAVATCTSAAIGWRLTSRLRRLGLDDLDRLALYPARRAAVSTVFWLACIPVMTIGAYVDRGGLHPIGYPHFVGSIVIAWLMATTYSSHFNILIVSTLAPDHKARRSPQVRQLGRLLPFAAAGIPLVAAGMFVGFFRPWRFPPDTTAALKILFAVMIAIGQIGFGCISRQNAPDARRSRAG